MAIHYVLVDFENIQPEAEALSFLNDEQIKIIIFVNAKQKLSVDRVKALQPFGDRVDYIEMSGSGKNSLDFIIAFYLGCIWNESPEAKLYVVSKDMGFDPLLKHLTTNRPGSVKRVSDCAEIKNHLISLKAASEPAAQPGTVRQRVISICVALQDISMAKRPYPVSALTDFIKTVFNDCDLSEQHIAGLINFMTRKELISIGDDGSLKYHLNNIFACAKGEFISKAPANNAPQKFAPASPVKELAKKVCDDLKKRGNSKPRTLKTLISTIKAIFQGDLSDQQAEAVLDFMKGKKIITISNDTKVTYNLGK